MPKQTPIIDVHHHLAAPGMNHNPRMPKWSIESDKEAMERLGFSGVLLSIPAAAPSHQTREMNEALSKICTFDPKFYGMLASLPYNDPDAALNEIEFATDVLKVDGFSLPTNYKGIYLSDSRMDTILAELNRRSAVVLVHPTMPAGDNLPLFGREPSVCEYPFETSRAMMDLIYKVKIKSYSNIRWIVSHADGTIPYLAYRFSIAREWDAIIQSPDEVLSDIKSLYYDLALSTAPNVFSELKALVGESHIVFGTDYPMRYEKGIKNSIKQFFDYLGFDAVEKEAIANKTAQELFPRFCAGRS